MGPTETQDDTQQAGESKPHSSAGRRNATPACRSCAGASRGGFGASTGTCGTTQASTINVAKAILVAAGTSETKESESAASAGQASETEAAQRDLL